MATSITSAATASQPLRLLTVADLHQRRPLYEQLTAAALEHRPDVIALVGDFLHAGARSPDSLAVEECSRRLNDLNARAIICVRGNHEDANWLDFLPGRIRSLNGSAFQLDQLLVVGFPCLLGDESWFLEGGEGFPLDAREWFPEFGRRYGAAARSVWLMHEPPSRTSLSVISGPLSGNEEWRDAIIAYQPMLVICGHDHQTPFRGGSWKDLIGSSLCVNAGQKRDELHYFVADFSWTTDKPSLPSEIVLHRFPTAETARFSGSRWYFP